MNLILFEASEVETSSPDGFSVTLPSTDRRFIHCTTVLHVDTESVVRAGVIGGSMYDAQVVVLTDTVIGFRFSEKSVRPPRPLSDMNISLILALPRPKVLGRLWPVFAQLGFRRVILIRAERVESAYFGSHFMHEENYRPLLVKGLEQASVSTRLPEISFEKRPLEVFLEKRLETAFPAESTNRFICHPEDENDVGSDGGVDREKETVIALGPEGGWLDYEIDMMKQKGFVPVTCSSRVFTTDVALIALTSAIACRLNPKLMGTNTTW
jgi:16S rRNA (uracil1498-N3)-methyltransferase